MFNYLIYRMNFEYFAHGSNHTFPLKHYVIYISLINILMLLVSLISLLDNQSMTGKKLSI